LLDRRREGDRPDLEAELARDDARYIQDVPHDPLEGLRILLDHLERARRGGLVQRGPAQQARPEENRTERRPELVGERRQELVLDAVGDLRLAARVPHVRQEPDALLLPSLALADIGHEAAELP